jgi:hypothetical protein
MAFRRRANALVSKNVIDFDEWMDEMRQQHEGAVSKDHVGRVAKEVLRKCDPKQYLLSHATIVASVDTYQPKGSVTGKRMERGVQIDVRYPDFRVKPACQEIINNNGDAWERSLLLTTYRTFIGAPNYLEHIQIPELSKGFIVDAIARDLGDTCYVDILVATDRKHQVLVRDIMAGNIKAMSMGCISLFTICNKCGNVASDDTQLCPCIMYDSKGSKFADDEGVEHRLGELIGHVSVPNSNTFIEASWVRNPAFAGAERRNFLNEDQSTTVAFSDSLRRVEQISLQRSMEPLPSGLPKAASARVAEGQDQGGQSQEPGDAANAMEDASDDPPSDDPPPPPPAEDKDSGEKIRGLVDKAQEMLMEGIVKGLADKLAPKPEDVPSATPSLADANLNETLLTGSSLWAADVRRVFSGNPSLISWALRVGSLVRRGRSAVLASGLTPRDLIVFSWIDDTVRSAAMPAAMYQAAMSAGASKDFPSERSYVAACSAKLGRRPTASDQAFFARIGRIASASRNV